MMAIRLDRAIRSVCPIDGVSIGRKSDRSTWRIDFKPEATEAQKLDARNILNSFEFDEKAATVAEEVKAKLREIDLASIRSLREYVASQLDSPKIIKDMESEATAARSKLK